MSQTFSRILVILLVSLTLTTCVLIPEFSRGYVKPLLLGGYAFLLTISMWARFKNIAMLLVLCGLALPISEFIWEASYYSWDMEGVYADIEGRWLAFSFAGIGGYVIALLIAPITIYLLGNVIREHRHQKAPQG